MNDLIKYSLQEAHEELVTFMSDDANIAAIAEAGHIMSETLKQGGKIISCGNGGSLCDATHFAEELNRPLSFLTGSRSLLLPLTIQPI